MNTIQDQFDAYSKDNLSELDSAIEEESDFLWWQKYAFYSGVMALLNFENFVISDLSESAAYAISDSLRHEVNTFFLNGGN